MLWNARRPPRDSPSKKAECPVYYSFSVRFSISQHCWQWHYRNACLPREVTKQNLLVTARFLSWKVKAVSYFVTRACPNTHQLPCFTKEASGNLLGTCNVVFFPPTSLVFLLWVTSVILKFQSSSPRMWHRVTLMAANRIWASVSRKFCQTYTNRSLSPKTVSPYCVVSTWMTAKSDKPSF